MNPGKTLCSELLYNTKSVPSQSTETIILSARNTIQASYATSHVSSVKQKVQEMHKNSFKDMKPNSKSGLSPGVLSFKFFSKYF